MQNIPVVLAVSQSADPQRQLPSFADVPSAMLQSLIRWSLRMSTSVQSEPEIFSRSLITAPDMYASVRSAFVKSTFVRSAISRFT